jgi:hypothetical protein
MTDPFNKLKDIAPKRKESNSHETEKAIESVGERRGFVAESAEPKKRYRRKPGEVAEPTTVATLRLSISSWNAFVDWCDQERMPYREAFDRLVNNIKN